MDLGRGIKAVGFGVGATAASIGMSLALGITDNELSEADQKAAIEACAQQLSGQEVQELPDDCEGYSFPYEEITTVHVDAARLVTSTNVDTTYFLPTADAFKAEQLPLVPTDELRDSRTKRLYFILGGFCFVLSTAMGFSVFRKKSTVEEGQEEYDELDEDALTEDESAQV